jgi:hypothetical protein
LSNEACFSGCGADTITDTHFAYHQCIPPGRIAPASGVCRFWKDKAVLYFTIFAELYSFTHLSFSSKFGAASPLASFGIGSPLSRFVPLKITLCKG